MSEQDKQEQDKQEQDKQEQDTNEIDIKDDDKIEEGKRYSVRQAQKDPSNRYLFKQLREKAALVFICYNGIITGKIQTIGDYEVKLIKRKAPIAKLGILYMFKPDAANIVKSSVSINKSIASQKLKLPRLVENRIVLPEHEIEKAFENKLPVGIALRNGHVFKGILHSNGIFSLRLDIGNNKRIVIMKHSIYAFKIVKELSS
jgi:sRNA-binding regulator protein Hfq